MKEGAKELFANPFAPKLTAPSKLDPTPEIVNGSPICTLTVPGAFTTLNRSDYFSGDILFFAKISYPLKPCSLSRPERPGPALSGSTSEP